MSGLANRFVTVGVWIFLTPFMVNHLGRASYGLWALIGSIVAYASLLDLGISASIVKFVAEHRAREEFEQLRALLASCLVIFIAVGAAVTLLTAILALFVPDIFNVPVAERGTASWAVAAAGLSAGLSLPMSIPNAVLSGLQRFDLVAISAGASLGLLAVSTIVILLLGGGVVALMVAGIPVSVFGMVLSAWFVRRVAPEIHAGLGGFDRVAVRRLGSFSLPAFALEASFQLETRTDELVIGGFLPVTAVGPYSIARRLCSLPELLTAQFTGTLMPLASQIDAQDSRRRVTGLVIAGTRTALAFFLPFGLGLMVLGGSFLRAWIGPAFGGAGDIVIVLAAATLLSTMLGPGMVVSLGTNRHRMLARVAVAAGLLNLALSIALVRPYGTLGVALGTLIATALRACVSVPYLAHAHGIDVRTGVRSIFVPTGLPAIPAIATLFALREAVVPSSVVAVLLVGFIGGLVYVCGYLCMPSCTAERELILREARRLRRPRSLAV